MRRQWQALRGGLALMLLASVGACMAPTPQLAAAPESMAPLDARIFPPYNGQVAFSVNKAAHVALFEIVPGRGVSLLYPTAGSGFTQVRQNWVPLQYSPQRWLYASNSFSDPAPGQWSGYDYGYGTGYYAPMSTRGMQRTTSPRYLFLVASEEPIEIEQFQRSLGALRQFLGPNRYQSYHPYDVMESLAYAIVPYTGDEQWVTDVFVDWGYDWGYGYTPGTMAAMASWQLIGCADGSVGLAQWVPGWGYGTTSCVPNRQQTPVTPVTPGDPDVPPVWNPNGRGRASGAGEEGRGRAGAGSARPQLQGDQTVETRSRIAQLREEAARAQFNDLLRHQLRTGVELRHRADALMGRGPAGTIGGSNGRAAASGSAGRASSSGSRAVRSRAPDVGNQPNAGRSSSAGGGSPRSREGSSSAAPRTQSAPASTQSSQPRSRESSSPPPSSAPAPSSSTRSRPPDGL